MSSLTHKLGRLAPQTTDAWLLLIRLGVGYIFMTSGYGKITHLSSITQYFESLGIPFAQIQAPFVSGLELIGGALLMLGLFSRPIAALLIAVMVVALATAKLGDINSIRQLIQQTEFLYILLLGLIFAQGPGRASVSAALNTKTLRESVAT